MGRYPYLPDYLADTMAPLRRLQEEADNLAAIYKGPMNPIAALERQIASLTTGSATEMIRQQTQMLDSLYGHSRSLTEQILGATYLDRTADQQLRALLRPPSIDATLGLLDRIGIERQSTSKALALAFAGLPAHNQIEAIFNAARQPAIEREVQRMLGLVRQAGAMSFDPIAQSLSFGGTTFPLSDFELAFGEAAAEADNAPAAVQLKIFLHALLAIAARLKGNRAVALTLLALMLFGGYVLEGVIQTISGELLRPVTDAIIRKLKPEVRERVVALQNNTPLLDVRSIRIVAAANLQVRAAPRRENSKVITRVSTPTVVMVIRQQKDWTLVQYRDGDAIVRGWVYSRYLARIDA